jgi:translocation and assembly module TamB
MKKRLLLITLTLLLLIPIVLFSLMNSQSGTRWLLHTLLPPEATIQTIQGNLLDNLELTDVHYQNPTQTIDLKQLKFVWQPSKIWTGTLKIVDVTLDGVNVRLSDAKQPEEEQPSTFDFNAPLALPIDVIVENFLLTNVQFQQGVTLQTVEKLQLIAKTEHGQLLIQTLAIDAKPLAASLQGQVALGKGFAFKLNTDWKLNADQQGNWQASTVISGDTKKITIDNQIGAPFTLALQGTVDNPLKDPYINAHIDWQGVKYPIIGDTPQIQSDKGSIELIGLLTDYRLNINAALSQAYLPEASLVLNSKGSLDALTIEKLELKSSTGIFNLGGYVAWKDKTSFDITATGQNFNPAIVMPDMAGNLSFDSHFKGEMTDKLQLDVAINKLAGQLRGYPVSADGKLLLVGDQLTVDALAIKSGKNSIEVNGTLGEQQAMLTLVVDTPQLNALWPTLGGRFKAQGSVQGAWQNPAVKLQANGQNVRFAEHSVEQLNIDIDYNPAAQKNSQLAIIAKHIKTGATHIAKLLMEGQGTPAQHSVKAEVSSPQYGDISTLITGGLKADNWQGALAKLNIDSKDAGIWQLKNAMNIRTTKSKLGVDVATDQGCLIQHHASVCVQGGYFANGDFAGQVNIADLPSSLIQAQLPPDIKLLAALNADANVQQKNGVLNGQYQINTTPIGVSVQNKELHLGESSVSGKLNGTQVFADINLALINQDAVRGNIQLDTGKSQTLSGQIIGSVVEFAALKPFAPQLSDLKGQLKADIKLAGSITKPAINGNIDLNNGKVVIAESGLTINDINLHALASGSNSIQTTIQGSLSPSLSIKPNSPDQVQFSTRINLNADLQQADTLTGNYQIDMPPSTINLAHSKLPLGASSLTGKLIANRLFAELKLALIKQDFLHAQVELATDASKTLSGQISASMLEFAALNPLIPQVANLKGQLKANVNLGGTSEKPTANGLVNFSGGEVDINDAGLKLRAINFQALAAAEHIQLKGSAKSGEGQLKLDGVFDLATQALDMLITGDNFEVAKLAEAEVAVSPQLTVVFAKNQGKITGKLAIPKAIIQLKQIPESAVAVSQDEVILGETDLQEAIKPTATNIDADINIELGKKVNFSGMGFKTDLQGILQLTKTGDKTAMYGDVNLKNGRYKSYGQDLTVRKGQFVFNGSPENPNLNVEAIRLSNDKKITAVLNVTGTPDRLKTRIYTEPTALPETEALAYLIAGKPLNQTSKAEGNMIAGAALSYGAGQASWLTEKLGLDEFEVQEGKTLQSTLLAVGQYLTPDFYVGAKVGIFNKQVALVVKRKLTDHLNVETQTGESQRIKLNYEIDTD